MIGRASRLAFMAALAAGAGSLIAPMASLPRDTISSTSAEPPKEELSRQRKRHLQRQARKQTRKFKK